MASTNDPGDPTMNRPARVISGLIAIAAATAVGVTTQHAGFTIITFVGTLVLPRLLGFGGPGGCIRRRAARAHVEGKLGAGHRAGHGWGFTRSPVAPGAPRARAPPGVLP